MLSGSTIDTFEARAERVTLNQAVSVVSSLRAGSLVGRVSWAKELACFCVTYIVSSGLCH